ncbi:PAS domain S-box protein [Desulforudis sp. 1031]|uniref:sensor domain-containing diguanylate cyclase/phosphohydrolase n=1 Tax=unclassified Candidatus Desulforudis TaxID=2635950 RepID=UPI003CE4DE2B
MHLTALSIVATMAAALILTMAYGSLYLQNRERHMGIWAVAWCICLVGLGTSLWIFALEASPPLRIVYPLSQILSSMFFLWGTHKFLALPMSQAWVHGSLLTAALTVTGSFLQLSFAVKALPLSLFTAAALSYSGILFLRRNDANSQAQRITGYAYLLWGLHKVDFPFIASNEGLAPWGLLTGAVIGFTVAIGMLVVHLQKKESCFRLLTKNACDVIFRYRLVPPVGFEYVSPVSTKTLGYSPEEHYKNPNLHLEMVHPKDRVVFERRIQELPVNADQPLVLRLIRKDGTVIWSEHRITPIYDQAENFIAVEVFIRDITQRKQMEDALQRAEREKATILNSISELVNYYDTDLRIIWSNKAASEWVGLPAEQMVGHYCYEIAHHRTEPCEGCPVVTAIKTGGVHENEITFPGGITRLIRGYPVRDAEGNVVGAVDITMDITERKQVEEALRKSEARYRELADSLPEVVFEMDKNGRLTFVNENAYSFFGYTKADFIRGVNALETIVPEDRARARENIWRSMHGEDLGGVEYTARRKDGAAFPILIHSRPIMQNGQPVGLRGFIIDITERKQAEKKLRYLSLCDPLTGLFNRTFFEQEMRSLEERKIPAGIILCDIDGLKLVNDTIGHETGDNLLIAAAKVIKKAFRDTDIIARVGGDEFAVLLPNASEETVESACRRIRTAVDEYNKGNPELPLSISVGYAVSRESVTVSSLFKEADNNMYREKLHRSQSFRSSIVQTLIKTLGARDFITEHHAENLQELVTLIGKTLGLPESRITDLRIFAQFHDIGKVGVPDRILFKPGPLTPEERLEMNRHSEIGYRIAQSVPDLAPITDWILKHHEWWNGEGYPLGLKGEEIPLECRILAIADAYDAMTSDRPYRKGMTVEQVLAQLEKGAGTQFDPQLVMTFVSLLRQKSLGLYHH